MNTGSVDCFIKAFALSAVASTMSSWYPRAAPVKPSNSSAHSFSQGPCKIDTFPDCAKVENGWNLFSLFVCPLDTKM